MEALPNGIGQDHQEDFIPNVNKYTKNASSRESILQNKGHCTVSKH